MTQMTSGLGAMLLTGGLLLAAQPAAALVAMGDGSECASNAECPSGFVCEVVGQGCSGVAAEPCPEGEMCEAPPPPDCQDYRACVAPPCMTNAECPSGMVCHEYSYDKCDYPAEERPACDPAAPDCMMAAGSGAPPPPECEAVTERECVAPYTLPCSQNSDCGDGFRCVQYESCGCSGSSGGATPPDSGDFAPPAPEDAGVGGAGGEMAIDAGSPTDPDCECKPSGEFYCELVEQPCSDASECPAGFSCGADPNTGVSTGGCAAPAPPPPDGDAAGSGGAPAVDAGTAGGCEMMAAPPLPNVCLPPYWDMAGGGGRGGYEADGEGGPTKGTANDIGTPMASGAGSDDGDSGAPHATSCAVSEPGAQSSGLLSLLGLLGVAALVRRRRAA